MTANEWGMLCERLIFRAGGAVGRALRYIAPVLRWLVLLAIVLLSLPAVMNYWLRNLPQVPEVPVSAIVFTMAAAFFMTAFAVGIYVMAMLVVQASTNVRPGAAPFPVPAALRKVMAPPPGEPTGGSFTVADDEEMFLREQFDILKKQGILTDTDTMDLETMAKELGLKMLLKTKGRTE